MYRFPARRRHAAGTAIRCGVNATIGKSEEYDRILPAFKPAKIVIVGGGPAGLEAARVAATKGHRVVLFEREAEIGGAVRLGSVPPGKEKMRWLLEYYEQVLADLGVDVRTSAMATANVVMAEHPDEVIVATGSDPLIPPVPGIDGPRVLLYTDVLRGELPSGQRTVMPSGEQIVVGGGGLVGCETALHLAENGNSVTIIEMLPDIALGMEPISRFYLLRELTQHEVAVHRQARIVSLSDTSVRVSNDGILAEIPFQHFVVAFGGKPRDFAQLPVPTRVAGDAVRVGKLVEAVRDGYAVGMTS